MFTGTGASKKERVFFRHFWHVHTRTGARRHAMRHAALACPTHGPCLRPAPRWPRGSRISSRMGSRAMRYTHTAVATYEKCSMNILHVYMLQPYMPMYMLCMYTV
jgi:hypothetical protein